MTGHNVLITGANGFIGRALSAGLLAAGHNVRGVVRHPRPGLPMAMEQVEIPDLRHANWGRILRSGEIVIHLAGRAHRVSKRQREEGQRYFEVNTEGTRRLAHSAAGKAERFVFLSSVAACTTISDQEVNELTPCAPDDFYGESKLAAERAVIEELGGRTDWCIIRPPLIYGPSSPGNMARLLRLLQLRLPLPFGGIRNRRSFIYIENLVSAIATAITHPAAANQTFYVADSETVSTPELLRRMAEAANMPARLFYIPRRVLTACGGLGDVLAGILRRPVPFDSYSLSRLCGSLVVDDSRFRALTGWTHPYGLDEALRQMFSGTSNGRPEDSRLDAGLENNHDS